MLSFAAVSDYTKLSGLNVVTLGTDHQKSDGTVGKKSCKPKCLKNNPEEFFFFLGEYAPGPPACYVRRLSTQKHLSTVHSYLKQSTTIKIISPVIVILGLYSKQTTSQAFKIQFIIVFILVTVDTTAAPVVKKLNQVENGVEALCLDSLQKLTRLTVNNNRV